MAEGVRWREDARRWRWQWLGMLLVLHVTRVAAVELTFWNNCGRDMVLAETKHHEKLALGAHVTKTLAPNEIAAFRYGVTSQATLAEFSIGADQTWYDIAIIPTGILIGPKNCTSLEDCKTQTKGGIGFNVALKIIPNTDEVGSCRVLECLADGCEDAYQFPNDPAKTHSCPPDVAFDLVFCASKTTGSSHADLVKHLGNATMEEAVLSLAPTTTPPPTPAIDPTVSTQSSADSSHGPSTLLYAILLGSVFVLFTIGLLFHGRIQHYRLERMNNRGTAKSPLSLSLTRDPLLNRTAISSSLMASNDIRAQATL